MKVKIIAILIATFLTAGCFAACSDVAEEGNAPGESTAVSESESVGTDVGNDGETNGDETNGDENNGGENNGGENNGGENNDGGSGDDDTVMPTMHRITAQTAGVKVLGVRTLASQTSLHMDWSCSGAEFTVDLKGTNILFSFTVSHDCYFKVWVDGELYTQNGSEYHTVSPSTGMLLVKELTAGKHTIRIMKVTGYTLARAELTGVTFAGSILTDTDTSDKELYIEFIGDSITCGWGTIGEHGGAYTDQDGTLAYPYLLAEALNADYSMVGISGHKLVEHLIKKDANGNIGESMYLKTSHLKSPDTSYDFARKADIVVINIGTNDVSKSVGSETFEEYYTILLQTVREKNGEDCKILCLYNAMNHTYESAILSACERMGGVDNGITVIKLDRADGNQHPNIAEHAAYAEVLKDVIVNLPAPFDPVIEVIPEGDGDSDGIDFSVQ